MKQYGENEVISWNDFREAFEGKEGVRFGLVRDCGAIMEQWANLGSFADIAAWEKSRSGDVVTVESVVKDLINTLGPNGPLICVFIEDEAGETMLVNPHNEEIYPNWE